MNRTFEIIKHKPKLDFAFIVHSRDRTDLPRKFPFLKYIPTFLFDLLTLSLPPFIVSNITGLKNKEGKVLNGVVIGIPMTAHQLLEHRERALNKIIAAVKLGKKKGARYFGLGAMTASLSQGGIQIIEKVENVYLTTGRTYTAKNIVDYIEYCMKKYSLSEKKVKVAIVGAAGGIGSGVSLLLAIRGFNNIILIDLERKLINLEKNIKNIEKNSKNLSVRVSHKVSDVVDCHIIVAATNAPEVVIKSEDVSPGTIIVNDAQPSDISPEILKSRKDVLVIEGGVLSAPEINCHFNFGLVDKNNIFSCLAEALLISFADTREHTSIGDLEYSLLQKLSLDAEKLNFAISRPQNSLGYISETQMKEFANIIRERFV